MFQSQFHKSIYLFIDLDLLLISSEIMPSNLYIDYFNDGCLLNIFLTNTTSLSFHHDDSNVFYFYRYYFLSSKSNNIHIVIPFMYGEICDSNAASINF